MVRTHGVCTLFGIYIYSNIRTLVAFDDCYFHTLLRSFLRDMYCGVVIPCHKVYSLAVVIVNLSIRLILRSCCHIVTALVLCMQLS